jgi:hypothetical protein
MKVMPMKHASECRCRPCRLEIFDRLIEQCPDNESKLVLAFASYQSSLEPRGQVIVPLPSMFHVSSKKDGYMVALIMAADEFEARTLAWTYFIEHERPDGEWKEYHKDKSELDVVDLGQQHFGADGEGHLEVS